MKTRRIYRRRKTRRVKRGGLKYYPYNTNPKLFTNSTSQLGGDGRTTLLPQPLANAFRSMSDSNTSLMNAWSGRYPSPSSNVLNQPINKIKM